MHDKTEDPRGQSRQIIQQESELVRPPVDGSPALAEIMSRSLVHIKTSKSLAPRHQVGNHELHDPDYRLVVAWAEELQLKPEEVLKKLLPSDFYLGLPTWFRSFGETETLTIITEGRFHSLFVDKERLPISDIPLIEGLTFKELKLWNWGNTTIQINLYRFRSLEHFDCGFNGLTDLHLAGAENLKSLSCGDNKLSELDLSSAKNLRKLRCPSNMLTEINLALNKSIVFLDLGGNPIKSIDLSDVPKLTDLECNSCEIENLDLSEASEIKRLFCGFNQLSELNLSVVSDLKELFCGSNQLSELDLTSLSGLELLNCSNNPIKELNLSLTPSLESLDCRGNPIKELDLRPLNNLKNLKYDSDRTCLVKRSDQVFK